MEHGTDFDWVKVRLNWSAAKAFADLKLQVEHDVRTRNAGSSSSDKVQFEVEGDIKKFTVFRYIPGMPSDSYIPNSVEFVLQYERISAKLSNRTLTATMTLDKDGRCIFKVGEEELESWQFRMKALEEIMFS